MNRLIVNSLRDLPDTPHVVTIGSFDGVHRGHQYLLEKVQEQASRFDIPSLAVTFDPLPAEVLRPDLAPPRLCSTDDRIEQMLNYGVDRVAVLSFDENLANQSAEDFLSELVTKTSPRGIVVGADFAFGHKRKGTPVFLRERAEEWGYELTVVDRINPDDDAEWSSSFARQALGSGDVRTASRVLGRPFRIRGSVNDGDHRGRDLGYPTANLQLPDRLIVPADGIYVGMVSIADFHISGELPALVYVGTRPTFGNSQRIIEVYLLDFNADLYGKHITVDFLDHIRGDRRFDSAEDLVSQMKIDEVTGRKLLASYQSEILNTDR
jgi:riboflavin kinase / FMN adenylyltransferase